MKAKETIAIIGATGDMGSIIAANLSKGNYRLILMSSDAEKLGKLKAELSAATPQAVIEANECVKEASWEADVIILACPNEAQNEIAEKIRNFVVGKIVISISNPLNPDYSGLITSRNISAAEELQRLLPHSKVVKAYNTAFPPEIDSPADGTGNADAFIAANNGHALEIVSSIVTAAGFNPVIAGDLSASRSLERILLKQIQIGLRSRCAWLAGWKVLQD